MFEKIFKKFLENYKQKVAQAFYNEVAKVIDDLPMPVTIETELKRMLEAVLEKVTGTDVATEFDIMGIAAPEGESEDEADGDGGYE